MIGSFNDDVSDRERPARDHDAYRVGEVVIRTPEGPHYCGCGQCLAERESDERFWRTYKPFNTEFLPREVLPRNPEHLGK
jgi:hypothetical protein